MACCCLLLLLNTSSIVQQWQAAPHVVRGGRNRNDTHSHTPSLCVCCHQHRAAVDLQIQQQKAQRDQLEALKQQELQQERQELQDWQQQLPAQGDEDDDLAAGDPAAAGTAADAGAHADKGGGDSSNSSSTASMQEVYHGKGWWPSKSADDHSQQPDTPCSPISGSTSSKGDAQEMITLSSSGGSSKGTHTSSCSVRELTTPDAPTTLPGCRSLLLNDAAAAAAAADQTTEQPFLSATSSRRLGPAAASAKHIATASSLTTATTTSSSASASQRPMKPVAPVRSRGVPVQVSFTQLETPHLPARQQREVEIKQIKRAAGQQVCGLLCMQEGPCERSLASCMQGAECEGSIPVRSKPPVASWRLHAPSPLCHAVCYAVLCRLTA